MRRVSEARGQGRAALPALVMVMLTAAAAPGAAADERWQVGTAPSFLSGTYGGDTRSDVLYTPITARRLFADGDATLVFPFMCVRGGGNVAIVNGAPAPIQGARTGGSARDGSPDRSIADASRTTRDVAVAPDTAAAGNACGLGDIVIRGRYFVADERGWLPTVALRAHLKLPTADAARGLGTGRADEGVGVEVSRSVTGGFMAMVDGGFTAIGKPAGADYQDTWWYDVGIGKSLAGDIVNVSVFFEEYRAIVAGVPDARDVLAAVTIKGAGGWRIQAAAEFGLSDGSPDHGITLGASRRF
jgi:hypothetical protein